MLRVQHARIKRTSRATSTSLSASSASFLAPLNNSGCWLARSRSDAIFVEPGASLTSGYGRMLPVVSFGL